MRIRINDMTSNYSQIAILHYWQAKKSYCRLSNFEEMCDEAIELENSLTNDSIVTITFAAMALESFFNDYAATHMGDKFFYENFDILRPMGKLKLIVRFILKADIINGSLLYNLADTLFKTRNNFVHSKSKDGSRYAMTEEEYQAQKEFLLTGEGKETFLQSFKIDLSSSKAMLETAFHSLCALREIGKFFDMHDNEQSALARLLFSNIYFSSDITTLAHVQEVQKELCIPIALG